MAHTVVSVVRFVNPGKCNPLLTLGQLLCNCIAETGQCNCEKKYLKGQPLKSTIGVVRLI